MGARPLIIAALGTAALTLAACGGSDSDSHATATPAGGAAVAYEGFEASPKVVTAKVGQPITWTNKDGAPHDVVSSEAPSGDAIKSPSIAQGKTFTFTPSTAGTISYVCSLHPQMTGYKVVVTQ
jgi:plastocyanin